MGEAFAQGMVIGFFIGIGYAMLAGWYFTRAQRRSEDVLTNPEPSADARCKECLMTSESRVPLLPDAKLDEHGVCGYCRRAGIQTEPSAVQEALEEMTATLLRCRWCCEYAVPCSPAHQSLVDALIAAVRAQSITTINENTL